MLTRCHQKKLKHVYFLSCVETMIVNQREVGPSVFILITIYCDRMKVCFGIKTVERSRPMFDFIPTPNWVYLSPSIRQADCCHSESYYKRSTHNVCTNQAVFKINGCTLNLKDKGRQLRTVSSRSGKAISKESFYM